MQEIRFFLPAFAPIIILILVGILCSLLMGKSTSATGVGAIVAGLLGCAFEFVLFVIMQTTPAVSNFLISDSQSASCGGTIFCIIPLILGFLLSAGFIGLGIIILITGSIASAFRKR